MLPEDARLLHGARRALAGVAQNAAPGDKTTLDWIDTVLCEMLLRGDRGFYRRHHADGLALAVEGAALAGRLGVGGGLALPAAIATAEDISTDALWQHLDQLRRALEAVVRALGQHPEARAYLERVVDWENAYHGRHAGLAAATVPAASLNFTADNLLDYLRQRFPERRNLSVRDVRVLSGGFSKKTVLLDMHDDANGLQSLVLRVEQPPRFGFWDGDQVENEFVVLQLIHEAGLLVPEPLWLETDKRHVGQKFIASRRAAGQNVGSSIGASGALDKALVRDAIAQLVRIHATRLDRDDPRLRDSFLGRWSRYATLRESTAAWVEHWLGCIRDMQVRPSPLTVRLMEWLRANVPDCATPPSLLHGDFGLHNVLVENGKVSAVLDWEYLTFGDPAEDLALLAISLGGQMTKDEIVAMYVDCGGQPISEFRLLYFDLIYAMKFIVPCENGLRLFQDHDEASLGLCKWGFTYTIAGVGTLNQKIALAEAAKAREAK